MSHRDRLRPFENKYSKEIAKEIRSYGVFIANQIDNDYDPHTFLLNGEMLPAAGMSLLLRDMYNKTGLHFIKTTHNQLRRLGIKTGLIDSSIWNNQMNAFFENEAASKIKTIVETQQDEIRAIIKNELTKGTQEGLGAGNISKNITKKLRGKEYGLKSRFNAARIARTEVNQAAQMARWEQLTPVKDLLLKSWIPTGRNTRPTHFNVKGISGNKFIPMDEPFQVGSYLMMRPSDSAGGIEEVVNCRCDLLLKSK